MCFPSYVLYTSWLIMVEQTPNKYTSFGIFCFCYWPFSSSFCFIFSYLVLETNVCTSLKVWQKHGVLVSSGKMMIQNLHLSISWIFHISTSLLWVCTVRTFWCMRWNVSNFVLLPNFSGAEFLLHPSAVSPRQMCCGCSIWLTFYYRRNHM